MEEKKKITIYDDGTTSDSVDDFAKVIVKALENSNFRALIAAAIETYHFKHDPIGWFLQDPKNNMEILKRVSEKMKTK